MTYGEMPSPLSFLIAYTIGIIVVSLPFVLIIERITRAPRRVIRKGKDRYFVE